MVVVLSVVVVVDEVDESSLVHDKLAVGVLSVVVVVPSVEVVSLEFSDDEPELPSFPHPFNIKVMTVKKKR